MAVPVPRLTPEEYLRIDRAAELKSEFHDGEMFPILAVSVNHSRLSVGLARSLSERLRNSQCEVLLTPLRVRATSRYFLYPDLAIVCGNPRLTDEKQDTLTNPKVILEILSPSTSDYDYGGKFVLYRQLPTVEEYLLIAQSEPKIEVFRKSAEDFWTLRTYRGLESEVTIESVQVTPPLREIYEFVEFPSKTT